MVCVPTLGTAVLLYRLREQRQRRWLELMQQLLREQTRLLRRLRQRPIVLTLQRMHTKQQQRLEQMRLGLILHHCVRFYSLMFLIPAFIFLSHCPPSVVPSATVLSLVILWLRNDRR